MKKEKEDGGLSIDTLAKIGFGGSNYRYVLHFLRSKTHSVGLVLGLFRNGHTVDIMHASPSFRFARQRHSCFSFSPSNKKLFRDIYETTHKRTKILCETENNETRNKTMRQMAVSTIH